MGLGGLLKLMAYHKQEQKGGGGGNLPNQNQTHWTRKVDINLWLIVLHIFRNATLLLLLAEHSQTPICKC